MILHHPLANPFCTCEKDKCKIHPVTDRHNHVERYRYETAALCPSMRELFPKAKPGERIKLLQIFAPDPRFPNTTIMTGMLNPPSLGEFSKDLAKKNLALKIYWEKKEARFGTINTGSLTNKERYGVTLRLESVSEHTKYISLLVNENIELWGFDTDKLYREMAQLLQNDVIRMQVYGKIQYLIFNFKEKSFERADQLPNQDLKLELFQKAYKFLKEKGKDLPIMNRRVVFADMVHA